MAVKKLVEFVSFQEAGCAAPERFAAVIGMEACTLKAIRTGLGWTINANSAPAPNCVKQVKILAALPAFQGMHNMYFRRLHHG